MPPDLSKRSSRILHIPIPSSIHLTCRPTVDRADEDSGPPLVSCVGRHQEVGGADTLTSVCCEVGPPRMGLVGACLADACDIANDVRFGKSTKEFVQMIIMLWLFFFPDSFC